MIILPRRITYDFLKSFWVVFCTSVALLLGGAAAVMTGAAAWLTLLAAAPLPIVFGLRYPEAVSKPYIWVNGALGRLAGGLRRLALLIVDAVIMRLLKTALGSRMLHEPLPDSMWEPKTVTNLAGDSNGPDISPDDAGKTSWFLALARWCTRTRKWWLLPVIPWLIVLSLVTESRQKATVDSHTYTLY